MGGPFYQWGHYIPEGDSLNQTTEACGSRIQPQVWPSPKLCLHPSFTAYKGLETYLHGRHVTLLMLWALPLSWPAILTESSSGLSIWGFHSLLRSEICALLWPGYSGPLPEGIRGGRNPAAAFIPITIGLKSQLSFNPRRRQWQPTPVLLPGKSHGWRNLVGCSPLGC